MEQVDKDLFKEALQLLTLHGSRAALKAPFLGKTPALPDEMLPTGSELKAYQDERELRDGLTLRLRRALRGHGLFATERLAVALGKVWTRLTERGEGTTFVCWLDDEFGILLGLTDLELLQISRLRNKPRSHPQPKQSSQLPRTSEKVTTESVTTQHPPAGQKPAGRRSMDYSAKYRIGGSVQTPKTASQ